VCICSRLHVLLCTSVHHVCAFMRMRLCVCVFCRALSQDPDNVCVLDGMGEIYLEHMGDVDKAREVPCVHMHPVLPVSVCV